jgi:LysR family transcriptional activator of nhaA
MNYHHLLYFRTVVREGSVAAAARELRLSQPTVSAQVQALQDSLGHRLFTRTGRRLALTETGQLVYRYAEEIFSLGEELADTLAGRPPASPLRFKVGVADVVPKLIAHRLLEPALKLEDPVVLSCFEGKPPDLLLRLAGFELDMVLTDAPIGPEVKVKAFNHLLGECGTTVFAHRDQARRYRRGFPESLDGAPFLYPAENTVLRRLLEQWLADRDLHPVQVAEFDDSALVKVFGQSGLGLFLAPSIIEREIRQRYQVSVVGRIEDLRERFYAISVERRVKHPAVAAITAAARDRLFAPPASRRRRSSR